MPDIPHCEADKFVLFGKEEDTNRKPFENNKIKQGEITILQDPLWFKSEWFYTFE